jgi:hypothetical protein
MRVRRRRISDAPINTFPGAERLAGAKYQVDRNTVEALMTYSFDELEIHEDTYAIRGATTAQRLGL